MSHTITCPFCEKLIASDSAHCPECSLADPLGAGLQELKDQVADRNLIVAIKKMREMCPGLGLADAKHAIEKLVAHKGAFPQSIDELLIFTHRSPQPERSSISTPSPTANAQGHQKNHQTSSSVTNENSQPSRSSIGCGSQILCGILAVPITFGMLASFGLKGDILWGVALFGIFIVWGILTTTLNFLKTGRFETF